MTTPLGDKMRALVAQHPEHAEALLTNATAFEAATTGYYADPQTVSVKGFMGAYARARVLYCKISGEALV